MFTRTSHVLILIGADSVASALGEVDGFDRRVSASDLAGFRSMLPSLVGLTVSDCAFVVGDREPELAGIAGRLADSGVSVVGITDDPYWFTSSVRVVGTSEPAEVIVEALRSARPAPADPDPLWDAAESAPAQASSADPLWDLPGADVPAGPDPLWDAPSDPAASAGEVIPADTIPSGSATTDTIPADTEAPGPSEPAGHVVDPLWDSPSPVPADTDTAAAGAEAPVPFEPAGHVVDPLWDSPSPAPADTDTAAADAEAPGPSEPAGHGGDPLSDMPSPAPADTPTQVSTEPDTGHLEPESDDPPWMHIGPSLFGVFDTPGTSGRSSRGQMIVCAGPKGGIGKTTMSLMLAEELGASLESSGRKVCWLDGNVGQADGAPFLSQHIPAVGLRTITSLARNPNLPAISSIVTRLDGLHFHALLGPRSSAEVSSGLITPNTYMTATAALVGEYDYVIVDTQVAEYGDPMFSLYLLPNLDYLVCLVPPIPAVVDRTRTWLQAISDPDFTHGNTIPNQKIGLLLNNFSAKGPFGQKEVADAMRAWKVLDTIPHSKDIEEATLRGDVLSARPSVSRHLRRALAAVTGEQTFAADGAGGLLGRFGAKR